MTRRTPPPDPPQVWCVLHESVIRQPVGEVATMRAQLRHLLTLADLPR